MMIELHEEDDKEFGRRLMALRRKTGLTQWQFAHLLGITRSSYSHYETGRRSPDRRMILRIANRFKVSLDTLLKGVEVS
ncbi:helix-turn-helix domain-containing protein [Cohnella yongneupensis]|uniref:Helix-turn-helix domain-containing protein n=1 Tax=Cohnella yongneupensis TaxID=425006 RepID=A0ABW0QWH3_9BACL